MTYTEVQKQILDQMPHFIAVNYQAMLDASDDEARVGTGLATFDRCLRLLTIVLATQYLIRDRDFVEPPLNKMLTERFPLGDSHIWRDVFLTTLKAYEGHPEWLFVPEVYYLYWDTDNPDKHHPRLEVEQTLDRLVALSNDWQGRKNLPTDAAGWAVLAREVGAQVDELLGGLAFLANYELMCITEASGTKYKAELHKSLEITTVAFEYEGELLQPNRYYLGKKRRDFLRLDPLLMTSWQTGQEETAIFKRLTGYNELRYLLSLTGNLFTDTTRLDEFIKLLMRTIKEFKQRPEKEELTWLQVTTTAEEIAADRMVTVLGKFDKDVYLQRQDALGLFKAFMASEARCFVLTGKSGAGKSNFVLSLRDEYKGEPDLCLLMIDASQIDTNKGLSSFVSEEFRIRWDLRAEDMLDVWEEINHLSGMDRRMILLVLDAVNENTQPRELLKQINDLLQKPWKWLKVLITSRPEAWRRMCLGQRLAEGLFFQLPVSADARADERPYLSACDLEPFDWDELHTVYTRYREKFDLGTPYDDLSLEVRQLIREPLQLWMVATSHPGQAIPSVLPAGELVEGYISALIETKRLYPEDVRFLQRELVPLLAPEPGQYTNIITAAALEEAGGNLLERVFSEGFYSTGERVNEPFQRLADAQIVVCRIQGMDSVVHFKYERFYDHFLGQFLFEQRIKPASDTTEVCQKLIDAIEDHPFLWGAVGYALYLTLDYKPDAIKRLAFTDSLNVSYLISAVLEDYAQSDPQVVRDLIGQIVSLSTAKRSNIPLNQRLQATEAALRVAGSLGDKETFISVLLGKEDITRGAGIKHAYYLNKREPRQALEILQTVSEEITRPSVTLNIPALQSTFRLAPLLVLDCYQKGELASPILGDLIATLRGTLDHITNKTLFRTLGSTARTWIVSAAARIFMEILRGGQEAEVKGPTLNNTHELSRFFSQPEALRRQTREALVYLDRTVVGSLNDVADLIVQLVQTGDRISELVAQFIVITRGIQAPAEAEAVLWRILDEVDNSDSVIVAIWIAVDSWLVITNRQPTISAAALETQKAFVSRWLGSRRQGYGVVERYDRAYQYYPLVTYGALWTKVHPGVEIDLFQTYMEQFTATGDRELLLHIIDTFGELRHPFHDYRAALRVLAPYVHESDPTIREHMVKSLGSLRGLYPSPVDHFLLELEAPRDLVKDIRSYSYQQLSIELYMRLYPLLVDLSAYAPIEFVRKIIKILDEALQAPSLNRMVAIIVNQLLDTLTDEES